MRKTLTLLTITLIMATMLVQAGNIKIVPLPEKIMEGKGSFTINSKTRISYEAGIPALKELAQLIAGKIQYSNGNSLPLIENGSSKTQKGLIILSLKDVESSLGNEGYLLDVNKRTIILKANSPAGIFYGIQSLFQLMPAEVENTEGLKSRFRIPAVTIRDHPRYSYRGLHLDVGRHMFPVEFIKKYINIMAVYKLNTFHWHLTDDQGWRIEIKKYPRLTEVGAWRNGTIIGHYPGTASDNTKHGGFYTQEEIKDVIAYARQRYITIIPEIEMPGHGSAAIAAYPWLSCFAQEPTKLSPNAANLSKITGGKQVQETWGVFDDVFCAGNDSTFAFLQDVLDEVIALFPSTYIHVGGDECPKSNWKRCPKCQARMQQLELKTENELQSYFIHRMEKYLNSKGRKLIGWDEILEGGLAPDATVMSWRGEDGGIDAAKQFHDVVMTPGAYCYLDHYQADPKTEPLAIGGYGTLKKVYGYEPTPAVLSAEEAKHILGAQGNVWTEYMATSDYVEYMAFPRAIALAEVTWSVKENRNYDNFVERMKDQFKRMDYLKVNYCNKAVTGNDERK
jgi:hexosaminidase